MKKAVIYNRISDAGQLKEQSLEVQQELCTKWARKHGYQVIGVFTDAAKSGTKTVGREALDDAIIRCQEKSDPIDALIVTDADRLARSEVEYFFVKNELKKSNTKIVAINQPMINESAEMQLFEAILGGTNTFYERIERRSHEKCSNL